MTATSPRAGTTDSRPSTSKPTRSRAPLLERESITVVAPGVHRLQRASVNCYLIESDDGITLVDGGVPGMWRTLLRALGGIGATPDDIDAVILTHGHFDHVGMCDRLLRDHALRPLVHEGDRELVRHPYRYRRQIPRWRYLIRYPKSLPTIAAMTVAGALWVEGVKPKADVRPGQPLDVPGRPLPVWTPGHTDGHCAFLLPDRGVLFTGDALVTLDPYTGRTGPRLVARAATADAATNLVSVAKLAEFDASVVLPGHGLPFVDGIRVAVREAVRAGAA